MEDWAIFASSSTMRSGRPESARIGPIAPDLQKLGLEFFNMSIAEELRPSQESRRNLFGNLQII